MYLPAMLEKLLFKEDYLMTSRPKGLAWIIGALLFAFLAQVVYWIAFFFTNSVQVRTDEVYLAFERAFPLADAWMAICALVGAIGLWRGRGWGFLFGLLTASSAVFLGLMDVLFNLNEGIYSIGGSETLIEIIINMLLLSLGPLVIVYLWKNRSTLICSESLS
jgi:hypothetical protein